MTEYAARAGMVLAAIRRANVPLHRVRPALEVLREEMGIAHALASRRLFTDGAELLFGDVGALSDADDVRELVVVRSGQRVFSEITRATSGASSTTPTTAMPA